VSAITVMDDGANAVAVRDWFCAFFLNTVVDWMRHHILNYEQHDHELTKLDWDEPEHRLVMNWESDEYNSYHYPLDDRGLLEDRVDFFPSDEKSVDLVDTLLRRAWLQTTHAGAEFVNVRFPDSLNDEITEIHFTATIKHFRFTFMYGCRALDQLALMQTRVHRCITRPNRELGETVSKVNGNRNLNVQWLHDYVCSTGLYAQKKAFDFYLLSDACRTTRSVKSPPRETSHVRHCQDLRDIQPTG
jgi:hypothetical protein